MELLRSWVMYVTGAAILASICMNIVPKGRSGKAVKLVCGMVTLLCLAYPLTSGGIDELEGFEFARSEITAFEERSKETELVVTRLVIEREYEAYILDKGEDLEVEISSADVSVRWSDEGYWYPVKAEINADLQNAEQLKLTQIISEELGIDPNNIYWS